MTNISGQKVENVSRTVDLPVPSGPTNSFAAIPLKSTNLPSTLTQMSSLDHQTIYHCSMFEHNYRVPRR